MFEEPHVSARDLAVVEICAGAGGQSLGLEQAGFGHLAAVEIDWDACNTLRHNRPEWHVIEGDVTNPAVFDPAKYDGVDLLAGGVPCPPFSFAGKQLGAQDERDLFAFAVHLLEQVRSRALLLENVRGLSAPRFAGYRARVLDLLHGWGYWAEWKLLNASDFGVPQLRPRFILVALKEEYAPYFRWPEPVAVPPTVGEVLYAEMAADGWRGAEAWRESAAGIAPTVVGGSKKHGGADLGPTRAKRAWRELHVDAMGIADSRPNELTPANHFPRLTNEMVAMVQGWTHDDEWIFTGRKTAKYRQIGNAFPPPVARAVGSSIARALRKEGVPRADVGRFETADAAVYRELTSAKGKFVSMKSLADRTGQSTEAVQRALRHLEADFVIELREARGVDRYRLVDFKGLTAPISGLEVTSK
jgi:DNA (cytosine-5)-methyltransferase 1